MPTTNNMTVPQFRAAVELLCVRHKPLAAVVEKHGPPPFWRRPPGYAAMVQIILEQQVSLESAWAVYKRLEVKTGKVTPENVAELGAAGLHKLGFTRQKAEYCYDLGVALINGEFSFTSLQKLSDDDARKTLLKIRGIGRWTADIYLLNALRRPDTWPHGDLALAAAAQAVLGLKTRPDYDELDKLAEQWAPWRAVAARILWLDYLKERGRNI